MNNIFALKTLDAVSARRNLEAFFHFARTKSSTFGSNFDYDSPNWEISDYFVKMGDLSARNKRTNLSFTIKTEKGKTPLLPDVSNFAKAYIRTQLPNKGLNTFNVTLSCLRDLNLAMISHGISEIDEIDVHVLTSAAELIRNNFKSPGRADSVRGRLRMIAKFLETNGMSKYPIGDWRVARLHTGGYGRVGKEFEERRKNRLPSEEALNALAQAFHLAKEPNDIIITSLTAIMCSAPERINELLRLRNDCIFEQISDDGSLRLSLRWSGSKGYPDHIKPLLPSMSDIAREAITRISKISAPAQAMAIWYEKHPNKLYLPDDLKHLRNKEQLDLQDIAALVGLSTRQSANHWVKRNRLPTTKSRIRKSPREAILVRFTDVEQYILKELPTGFPVFDAKSGLLFSEALLIVPRGVFSNNNKTSRCMFESVRYHHLYAALSNNRNRSLSVFFRVGLDPEKKLSIKSHQFRHWLNTLAQGANLSQYDIAKWSGRTNIHQNAAYDHVSSEEILSKIRDAVGDHAKSIGPLAEIPKKLPVTREEFAEMVIPTAHVTLYGFCIHDFSTMPCEMFRKCLDCREHVCIKGIMEKTEQVRLALDAAYNSLAMANHAVMDEIYGAEDWVDVHRSTVERLEELLSILNDPNVDDGAVIQLKATNIQSLSEGSLSDRLPAK